MTKEQPVDKQIEIHLREKRIELIWALSLQDYTNAQIARMFNLHPSTTLRIIRTKPRDWQPKWKKVQE
jgi:DNA-binding CsgD family transcriptional regulator